MRVLGHIVTIAALFGAFLVVPARLGGVNVAALMGGATNRTSSATQIQDAPLGTYTIFVNRRLHKDKQALDYLLDFLAGEDVPLIMEDVSCVVATSDVAGLEMAQSLASRLPANQMKVRAEDGILMVSKAEVGRFDIMVLSDETAAALDVTELASDPNVEVVHR